VTKCGSPLKNSDGLCPLEGYRRSLPIIRYKHQRYQGGLLMASYTGMYKRSKKGIKTRMETTVGLYGKGNECLGNWCKTAWPKPFCRAKQACFDFSSPNFNLQGHIRTKHLWSCSKDVNILNWDHMVVSIVKLKWILQLYAGNVSVVDST